MYFDDFKIEHIKSPVVSSQDYYPFGLAHSSYQRENALNNQYQYNGKEAQDELGLNWLDYGARMYMPELGRWGVVDSRAEIYSDFSPYNYVANNPMILIDPNGKEISIYYTYTYTDNDGNQQQGNGSIVWKPGDKYDANKVKGGDNEFVKNTMGGLQMLSDALDKLGEGNYVSSLANRSKDEVDIGIQQGEGGVTNFDKDIKTFGDGAKPKPGSQTMITWDMTSGTKGTDRGGNEVRISPVIGLGHELGHADKWYSLMRKTGYTEAGFKLARTTWSQQEKRGNAFFKNENERAAITEYEHKAVRAVNDGSGIRWSYSKDTPYVTQSPFTTKEK